MTRAQSRDPGRAAKRIQINPNKSKEIQGNPRKSKEIQIKKLGFPWIPLAESGLFNGLQRIQIKKIFPRVTLYLKCHNRSSSLSPSRPPRRARATFGQRKTYIAYFRLSQAIYDLYA
jgi:hypothetical protein